MNNCHNCAHYDHAKKKHTEVCGSCCVNHERTVPSHWAPVTVINADRIRAMSDDELAWELMTWRCEAEAKHHGISSVYPDTQSTILAWLQQPVKEE